jgi:hypothetical protein
MVLPAKYFGSPEQLNHLSNKNFLNNLVSIWFTLLLRLATIIKY